MLRPQESGDDLIFQRSWEDDRKQLAFDMSLDKNHFAVTRWRGKGSMEGTRTWLVALDDAEAAIGDVNDLKGLVDLKGVRGTPIRAQFSLGKWLLNHRENFYRIAVFGGPAWEMKIARAVCALARFKNVGFFGEEEEALAYLNGG